MHKRGRNVKRYCQVCRKIHEGRCERPRQYGKYGKRNSAADKFRNSQSWRRKTAVILERDFHCCRLCASAGVICTHDLSVHHIVPLSVDYDKRLDDDNLITLCRLHHEQAERGAVPAALLRRLAAEIFRPEYIPPEGAMGGMRSV